MKPEYISLLVCPLCHGKLISVRCDSNEELWCTFHGIAFPVINDMPIMFVDQARRITQQEKASQVTSSKSKLL